MKKKFLSLFTAALMAASLLVVMPAASAGAETSGDYEYTVLDDGTVEITNYYGSDTDITIPSEIDGKSVTEIGYYAFAGCSSLASVTIPYSVTSIGDCAFHFCENLESINVDDSNPIYSSVDGVLYEGETDLIACPGAKTNVIISDTTTWIWSYAFWGCTNLVSVTIPDGVTSIGEYAFASTSLESVTIPDSVTSIGQDAFDSTPLLNNQTTTVKYAGNFAVDCDDDATTAEIKDGTVGIADYTFYACTSLESVTIPDSVTSIGNYAFSDCTSLVSLTIPDSVTSIGYDAFAGCENLVDLTIPAILDDAFGDINGDENCDIKDLSIAYKHVNKTRTLSGVQLSAADLNGDGVVDVKDVYIIYCYINQTDAQTKLTNSTKTLDADDTVVSIAADKSTASRGDTITYTVSFSAVEKLAAAQICLIVPDGLTVVEDSATYNTDTKFTGVLGSKFATSTGVYLDINEASGYTSDDETWLFTFKCKVDDDAAYGDYEVGFETDGGVVFINNDAYEIPTKLSDGAVVSVAEAVEEKVEIVLPPSKSTEDVEVEIDTPIDTPTDSDEVPTIKIVENKIEVENVPDGTYELTFKAENCAPHTYSATVKDGEIVENLSIELNLYGDISGEGELDIKDMSKVYKDINDTSPLEGYSKDVANVNGDSSVDIKDYSKIYKHINKTALLW